MGKKSVPTEPRKPTTEEDIKNGIMGDEIFVIVKCNMKVPKHLEDHFSDFPPIFKNVEIKLEDIGPHVQEYTNSIGRTKGFAKSLISSMSGKGMVPP